MRLGKLPTGPPKLAVDFRGATYTVLHPSEVDDSSDGGGTDGFGQRTDTLSSNSTDIPSSEELLYFHDRRMDVEQTSGGERRVERIESTAKPEVRLEKDDRTDHDGVTWEVETVESQPTPQNPTIVCATWKKRVGN